jgi:hypothetical protein
MESLRQVDFINFDLRVGAGTDRVRIWEPLTPSFRVVRIRDVHNFSGRAIRFVSRRPLKAISVLGLPIVLSEDAQGKPLVVSVEAGNNLGVDPYPPKVRLVKLLDR